MDMSTPVLCPSCGASRWQVTYHQWVDNTVEYTMTTPGAVDAPRETEREADESLAFACAACGESADDGCDEALREQARRVSLDQDGKIDWQSDPGA
jgi:predicted RNA-binding Zn-ribbon protein involved in translation (DUF1610 family)